MFFTALSCPNTPLGIQASPEDLKGRVLLKAKNLYVSDKQGLTEKEITVDVESSTTDTSASESELASEVKQEWRKARKTEVELIKGTSPFGPRLAA